MSTPPGGPRASVGPWGNVIVTTNTKKHNNNNNLECLIKDNDKIVI